MENTIFVLAETLFVLKTFNLLSCFLGLAGNRSDKKAKINFKIYDVINWETNSHNTCLANILKSKSNQNMKFGQLIEYKVIKFFLKNYVENKVRRLFSDLFFSKRKASYRGK